MTSVMQVEELVAEWRRRFERGEYASADELCSDCPELVAEVERRIEEIEHSPAFVTQGAEASTAVATVIQSEPPEGTRDTLVFQHRFSKLRFLARGGLGEIYVADDLELQRDVVLKFIRARHLHRAECQTQFQLEAEVTAKLDHPGVVPVYGIGRTPDGRPCYAMRFIHGVTLDETIAQFHAPHSSSSNGHATHAASPFSVARTSELHNLLSRFITSCKTIAYAHNRGIVHRDLKPDNIMLGKYGETLVVDWGLAIPVDRDDSAKASGEETLLPSSGTGSSNSSSGGPVGTPAYMSPEQANGAAVRPASDIFSLGATLYKLLTGQAPYSGESVHEVVTKARYGSFVPPRRFDKHMPRPLAAICEMALSIDPSRRYLTALDLATDLERWLADEPVVAYQEGFSERLGRWTRQHRVWTQAILTALVVVSLVVTLAAMLLNRSANSERDARTTAEATQKDSLQLAAEFVAKAVGQDLQSRWLILERETADPELQQRLLALESNPVDPSGDRDLQLWLSDRLSQYESIAPSKSWAVFDRQGMCLGRYPKADIIGKSFVFRDYFHGLGRDVDPAQKQDLVPLTRPHRSNVYRSKADESLVVALSAPIWAGVANERRVIGVLTTSVQIGQFGILESQLGGDRVLKLIDTNNSALDERGTVLYDSRSQNGTLAHTSQRIPDSLLRELEQLRLSRVQQQQQRQQMEKIGLLKESFLDATDDKTARHWIAAFEPVILRTASHELHDTGWIVVVQQPASERK